MPRKNYHFFVSFIIIFLVLASSSAFGHSLKVFAQPDGDSVRGYAFFVGGGRPHGALWVAKMGEETIADGQTNNKGEYAFDLPKTIEADVKITVDARDGHVASTTLSRDRFLSLANEQKNTTQRETSSQSDLKESSKAALSSNKKLKAEQQDKSSNALGLSNEDKRFIAQAVEHQMAPVMERMEMLEARLRFTDILSGIFLIIGLAGIGLWAYSKKND